jgi:hypothetical protein
MLLKGEIRLQSEYKSEIGDDLSNPGVLKPGKIDLPPR